MIYDEIIHCISEMLNFFVFPLYYLILHQNKSPYFMVLNLLVLFFNLREAMAFGIFCLSFSSFGPSYMAPYHADYWVVDFQTHNRGHWDTIICTSIVLDKIPYTPCIQFLLVVFSHAASSLYFYSSLSVYAPSPPLPCTLLC